MADYGSAIGHLDLEAVGGDLPEPRRRIMLAAARLFRHSGFAAVSMRDIGEAVGLSKAGLYHHCKSKDDLLRDIVRVGYRLLLAQLERVRELAADPEWRLREFLRTRMEVLAEFQDIMLVIWQERPLLTGALADEGAAMASTYRAGVRELIQAAQRAGVLRADLDVHLLTLAIDGMTGWACFWYHPEGQVGAGRIGEDFWSFLFIGIQDRR